MTEDKIQTLGEYRVGIGFNPSKCGMVNEIKAKAAELIDLIEAIKPKEYNSLTLQLLEKEKKRLAIIAQDQIESAAMFAVKAATKQ